MINKIILLGHVGKDPESKTLTTGAKVVSFTLATSESWKDKNGEKQTATTWHNVSAWDHLAEVIEKFVKKGDRIYLEGKINHRQYEKEGEKRIFTEIQAKEIKLLGGHKEHAETVPAGENASQEIVIDELPF